MRWREYISANVIVMMLMVSAFILNYLLNLALANYLAAHQYGDFALTLRIMFFLVPLTLLGTEKSTKRFMSKYLYTKEIQKFLGFNHWTYRVLFHTTIITVIIQLLLLFFILIRSNLHLSEFSQYHLILYALWIIPLISLSLLQSATLQTMKYYAFSLLSPILYPIIMYIALTIFLRVTNQLTLFHALISLAFSYLTIIIIQYIIIHSKIHKKIGFQKSIGRDQSEKKNWLHISISLMFNTLLYIGLGLVNLLILELIGTSEAEVGHFAAILTISSIFILCINAANYILNPKIIIYVQFKGKLKLQKLISTVTKLKTILGLILLTLLFFFGKDLLGHFGYQYIKGYDALLIVSIALCINLALGSAESLLIYANQQTLINCILFLELCINTILTIILVPKFHINGAAIAMCISIILSSVLSAIFAFKTMRIRLI